MSYYVPREEAEQARFSLFDDGEYDAIITKIEVKKSGGGEPMAVVDLKVRDVTGKYCFPTDRILLNKDWMWKYMHAADSAGLGNMYDDQTLTPQMLVNKRVRVKLKLKKGEVKKPEQLRNGEAPGTRWHDKNEVVDYLTAAGQPKAQNRSMKDATPPPAEDVPFEDSDIPF